MLPVNRYSAEDDLVVGPTLLSLRMPIKQIRASCSLSYAIAHKSVFAWGTQHSKKESNMGLTELQIEVDDIAVGAGHTFAWKSSTVYCWGSNYNYELGLEEERNYECHQVRLFEEAFAAGYVLGEIACGDHHTLAYFICNTQQEQHKNPPIGEKEVGSEKNNIKLFGWGQSSSHQLTLNTTSIIPYPVQSQFRIAQLDKLYAKSDFSAILGDGNVYTWGGNIFSRLGIQSLNSHSQTPDAMLPMRIPLPEQICTVALGTYHVVAVSRTGAAYAWGKGNQGQLGIGKLEAEAGPTKVICHEPIKEASCGEHHTLVVLHSGRLKSCGSNLSHALGHSLHDSKDRKKRCKVFQYVDINEEIDFVAVACGSKHSLALDRQGNVYGWGSNQKGEAVPICERRTGRVQLENKKQRKSLELVIDDDNCPKATNSEVIDKQNLKVGQCDAEKQHSDSHLGIQKQQFMGAEQLQRLLDWQQRYRKFQNRKRLEEEQFMRELEEIIGSVELRD